MYEHNSSRRDGIDRAQSKLTLRWWSHDRARKDALQADGDTPGEACKSENGIMNFVTWKGSSSFGPNDIVVGCTQGQMLLQAVHKKC